MSSGFGLQIFDDDGNITLDTQDITVKDFFIYANSSITSATTISVPGLPANSIVTVTDNAGGSTVIPDVVLDTVNSQIVVKNGKGGWDVGVRVCEL